MLNQWQLQEAKNKFSYVVKQAQKGEPQYITVHGKPTAVVISVEDYQQLNKPYTSLSEVLMTPLIEQELDLSRNRDMGRNINFD
jgi:prevent-host-death family protein